MRPSSRLLSTFIATDASLHVKALNANYSWRWLRDACQCPACVHPSTRQKLFRTTDHDLHQRRPLRVDDQIGERGLDIHWTEGHTGRFTYDFLNTHSSPAHLSEFHRDVMPVAWDRATAEGPRSDLDMDYEQFRTDEGLLKALEQLAQYGLLFLSGVPHQETADSSCELRVVANRFGELRTTFYGDVWDVKAVRDSKNIAYTNLDLGLHMDLLYFQHPPRFQILHCLKNRVSGGASYFVDGLRAARDLLAEDRDAFYALATTPVSFHYINDGHHLHHDHPTIELDWLSLGSVPSAPRTQGQPPLSESDGETLERAIRHVNYSPPFQAPLRLNTPSAFYAAFRSFARFLDAEEGRVQRTMRAGDAVVFDNRRVLHARTAFSELPEMASDGGETNRWLKGCYLEADALWDRMRVLRGQSPG